MKKVLFYFVLSMSVLLVMSCASVKSVPVESAVSEMEVVVRDTIDRLAVGEEMRSELDEEDSVLAVSAPVYYTPYDSYVIEVESGTYELELISLGNMLGFKKSIMVPMVALLDENGEQISCEPIVYEVRKNNMSLPVHIYSKWKFSSEKKQDVYVVIHADMSSTDKVVANGTGVFGVVPFTMTLPLKRTAYARYRVTPSIE